MNNSMINSKVSMHGIQQKLDILANNMANVNTVGYKRKEATFEDILTTVKQQPTGFQKDGRLSPLGFTQGWGAKLSQVSTQFAQGSLKETGVMSDLSIEGNGLFEVAVVNRDAAGNLTRDVLYTRDGSFQQSVGENNNVYLSTKDGHLVMGEDGNPISIPQGYKFSVDDTGTVRAFNSSVPEATAQVVGRLNVVRILRPQFLQQVGDNMFTIPAGTAATEQERNNIVRPIRLERAQGTGLEQPIKVRQGFLEQSNVDLTDEMTELVMVQRAFQLSSRALTSADTMMNLANTLRG